MMLSIQRREAEFGFALLVIGALMVPAHTVARCA
jgi:hypothetical protein